MLLNSHKALPDQFEVLNLTFAHLQQLANLLPNLIHP